MASGFKVVQERAIQFAKENAETPPPAYVNGARLRRGARALLHPSCTRNLIVAAKPRLFGFLADYPIARYRQLTPAAKLRAGVKRHGG